MLRGRHSGILVSSLVFLAIAGCSTVGEKDFACPGRPPGVRCMSATEVYAATHTTDVVAATAPQALGDHQPTQGTRVEAQRNGSGRERQKRREGGRDRAVSAPSSEVSAQDPRRLRDATLFPASDKPIPIRTPAKVMRVWIAPWEDARGILHAGGYHFIEVESRRWMFGETATTTEPVRFFSIQSANMDTSAQGDTKGAVGKDHGAPPVRTGTSERSKRPHSSTLSNQGGSP